MDINNVESINLIPFFMREDNSIKGLCKAIDYIFYEVMKSVRRASIFNLEYMDEVDLDYIASAENVFWYDSSDDRNTKIDVLLNYKKIYRLLGTVYAVEQLLSDLVSSEVRVEEWFNYNGEPFSFKIVTSEQLTESTLKYFYERIKKVKNVRSMLDSIVSEREVGTSLVYCGQTAQSYVKNVIEEV